MLQHLAAICSAGPACDKSDQLVVQDEATYCTLHLGQSLGVRQTHFLSISMAKLVILSCEPGYEKGARSLLFSRKAAHHVRELIWRTYHAAQNIGCTTRPTRHASQSVTDTSLWIVLHKWWVLLIAVGACKRIHVAHLDWDGTQLNFRHSWSCLLNLQRFFKSHKAIPSTYQQME